MRDDAGPTRVRWVALGAGAVILGVLLAVIADFLFFRGGLAALNLVVWALVGIVIGMILSTWPRALLTSALLGFTIVFTYSVLGYRSNAPIAAAILPFALIALVGALGMAVAGAAGHGARRLVRREIPASRTKGL